MSEIIGNYRPETIVIHGSALDPERFHDGSDLDVVGTAPEMTDETRSALLAFMRTRGIDPEAVPVDYMQGSHDATGALLIPSPLGIEVPYEVIHGDSAVRLDETRGLAAALRASELGGDRQASEELDKVYIDGTRVVTDVSPHYKERRGYPFTLYFEDVATPGHIVKLVDDTVIGVAGLKKAFEHASPAFTHEFLRRMKYGKALMALVYGGVKIPRMRIAEAPRIRVADFKGFSQGIDVRDIDLHIWPTRGEVVGGLSTDGSSQDGEVHRHFDTPEAFSSAYRVKE